MNANRVIIIADDLTGANDTAIQFVKYGMTALVVIDAVSYEPSSFSIYDILSFNSDTRAMNPKDAYAEVRNLIRRLKAAKLQGLYYKKVDSVLRGNPGPELAALMDELDIPLAIVCPSFPANMSVLEHGILKSGRPGKQSAINAVEIFAGSMEKKVDSIPLEIIRQGDLKAAEYVLSRYNDGAQVFIADALCDEDLLAVRRFSEAIKKPLVMAGSAALANKIAQSMEKKQTDAKPSLSLNCRMPALVIAGTRQGETAAQVSALSNTLSIPVVRFKTDLVEKGENEKAVALAFDEAARYMKDRRNVCIVAVESMFVSEIKEGDAARNEADGGAVSSALGTLACRLSQSFQFGVMITTGGDTTLKICKCFGITGIQPLAEICPGIPVGRITGGICDNKHIITKSGRFGNRDTLVEIIKFVNNLEAKEKL